MSTVSECVGATSPHTITHKGKTYSVSLVTQKVKADFEKKRFAQARDAAVIMRDTMSADDYRQHLKMLNDDYLKGEYALESSLDILQTRKGCLLLMSLLVGVTEMEAMVLLKDKGDELAAILQVVLQESFGELTEEGEGVAEAEPFRDPA